MADNSGNVIEIPKGFIIFIATLCFAGFLVAGYLSWLHWQVYVNPSFHSFCAISDSFNCETVAESPWSVFLGMPVAVWGILGYLVMFFLMVFGIGRLRLRSAFVALCAASMLSILTSAVLAVVSYCVICSFCVMCTVTYVINFLIFLTLIFLAYRFKLLSAEAVHECVGLLRSHPLRVLILGLVLVTIAVLYPRYWVKSEIMRNKGISSGVTSDGHYWIGSEDAPLTITEFSDYLCPHCQRMHFHQRDLISLNSGGIKLIHRHFPLDNACNPLIKTPFHVGACLMAAASICSGKQNKFWEMNDLLFKSSARQLEKAADEIDGFARKLGLDLNSFNDCLNSKETSEELARDINDGLDLHLSGTPSFIIDGRVHVGVIGKEVLQKYGIKEK